TIPVIAAATLAATWFFGLLATTPLYQPYPRLLMPWWMVIDFLLGWAVSAWRTTVTVQDNGPPAGLDRPRLRDARADQNRMSYVWRGFHRTGLDLVSVGWGMILLVVLFGVMFRQRVWEGRLDFRNASFAIAEKIESATDSAIAQVYGLPPVVLALREHGVAAVVCGGPEAAARLAGAWLVVSSDADRDSTWNDHWPKVADQFELVRTIQVQPSSIVRLDNGPMPTDPPPVEVRVYRHR
ncbi:MAG: hypothetical protein Q8K78_02780, partial [Planctomycetaceae bacterium]|nr:hypothetical protein [Planctomycetaceae bacterium]